jgi:hypothetical protein
MHNLDAQLWSEGATREVFFALGLAAVGRDEAAVAGPVLIAVLSDLGLSESAARAAILRLRRHGWLSSERHGRRTYYAPATLPGTVHQGERTVGRSLSRSHLRGSRTPPGVSRPPASLRPAAGLRVAAGRSAHRPRRRVPRASKTARRAPERGSPTARADRTRARRRPPAGPSAVGA